MLIAIATLSGLTVFLVGLCAGMGVESLRLMTPEDRRSALAGLTVIAMFVGGLVLFLGFIGIMIAHPEWI